MALDSRVTNHNFANTAEDPQIAADLPQDTANGQLLYAIERGTYFIKLNGDVRAPACASIEEFINAMFADSQLQSVLIDVSEATGLDSTTLGLLAKISLKSQSTLKHYPTLVSANSDISKILASMGFEQVFNLIEKNKTCSSALAEIPKVDCCASQLCEQILDAHKTLMTLNENNRITFKSLVEALEVEVLEVDTSPKEDKN